MIRILFFIACLVLFLGICDLADARCGGGSARGGRMAERRAMRRGTMMMSYSRSTTTMQMRAGPSCQSCAPAQMPQQSPPVKK